jgi:hypothetical protein
MVRVLRLRTASAFSSSFRGAGAVKIALRVERVVPSRARRAANSYTEQTGFASNRRRLAISRFCQALYDSTQQVIAFRNGDSRRLDASMRVDARRVPNRLRAV